MENIPVYINGRKIISHQLRKKQNKWIYHWKNTYPLNQLVRNIYSKLRSIIIYEKSIDNSVMLVLQVIRLCWNNSIFLNEFLKFSHQLLREECFYKFSCLSISVPWNISCIDFPIKPFSVWLKMIHLRLLG